MWSRGRFFHRREALCDLLIKGGTIYDGTLKPPCVADTGIKSDKIAAIGILSGEANKTLDASGFIVTPGFIDIHEHSDIIFADGMTGLSPDVSEKLKGNYNSLFQGVTTVVTGNCGNAISSMTYFPAEKSGLAGGITSAETISILFDGR